MLLADKKVRCPTCGAKCAVDAPRCPTCTRPLHTDEGPAAAVYQAALWGESIDAKRRNRQSSGPWALLMAGVLALVVSNYLWFKKGPDWAHAPRDIVKAADWKTYRGESGFRIDLPGDPMNATVTGPAGPMSTSTVWIDGSWLLVRDEQTRAAGPLAVARDALHATLVAASGPAPTNPRDVAAVAVNALLPGAQFDQVVTTELQDPTVGQQFEVTARFGQHPDAMGHGDATARVVIVDDRMLIAASFTQGAPDAALFDELLADFEPDADPRA